MGKDRVRDRVETKVQWTVDDKNFDGLCNKLQLWLQRAETCRNALTSSVIPANIALHFNIA